MYLPKCARCGFLCVCVEFVLTFVWAGTGFTSLLEAGSSLSSGMCQNIQIISNKHTTVKTQIWADLHLDGSGLWWMFSALYLSPRREIFHSCCVLLLLDDFIQAASIWSLFITFIPQHLCQAVQEGQCCSDTLWYYTGWSKNNHPPFFRAA